MKTSLHKHHFPRTARRASVLVVVMWIVFGLISLTLYFASSMTFELRASDNRIAGLEAESGHRSRRRYITCVPVQSQFAPASSIRKVICASRPSATRNSGSSAHQRCGT